MEEREPELDQAVKVNEINEVAQNQECQEHQSDEDYDELQIQEDSDHEVKLPKRKLQNPENREEIEEGSISCQSEDLSDCQELTLPKLPKEKNKLTQLLRLVETKIHFYKNQFINEQKKHEQKSYVGDDSIPICADVTKLDFDKIASKQLQIGGRQFDVIMMDPPWKLSSSQPSRGVAIQYDSLGDEAISQIPVEKLQTDGFLLVWVINAKFQFTVKLMEEKWGYKVVDSINWIKRTVNGKIAKGHGFYLQHAKQTCIVGIKGNPKFSGNVASDIIYSERRGQSQKPTQIYQYVEQLVPNGFYLQIFGRRNNLRSKWVTIGNEL